MTARTETSPALVWRTGLFAVPAALALVSLVRAGMLGAFDARDYRLYMDATTGWLGGGSFYAPWQLAGPYDLNGFGPILYPPVTLLLLAPFTVLPALFWWAIPLAITMWALVRLRPGLWGWLTIAMLLAMPPTVAKLLAGNPSMWVVAALSMGVQFAGPAVLVLVKPSLFPFALAWIRSPRWWLCLGLFGLLCIPFGAMWLDWLTAVTNLRQGGILYSWVDLPLMLVPVVAYVNRTQSKAASIS
jgi:hypothetical protein